MAATPVDLYVFGNRSGPRRPRPGIDVFPDAAGMLSPEDPADAKGASLFADPLRCPLTGHYYKLPAGTPLPEGLAVVADGSELKAGSPHPPTHQTLYPAAALSEDEFIELFNNLPWEYTGKK
jgi:hypothetical protein